MRSRDLARLRLAAIGSALLAPACLPPARLPPPSPSAAETPAAPAPGPDDCLALLDERGEAGELRTRVIRWGPAGVDERLRPGLVVGDADELYALTLTLEPYPSDELYGAAAVTCEEPTVWLRKLPGGVAQPALSGRPSCVGEDLEGARVEVRSGIEIVSVLGPFLGWREQVDERGAEPESGDRARLRYQTLDVRDGQPLDPEVWLRDLSQTMREVGAARLTDPDLDALACELKAAPVTLAELSGFAVAWPPEWTGEGPPRIRVGYRCCAGQACELDDPLPPVDPELGRWLPDPDRLLHSPHGCGSLGLDGRLRTRDGAVVGQIALDPSRLIGVVFVPADRALGD